MGLTRTASTATLALLVTSLLQASLPLTAQAQDTVVADTALAQPDAAGIPAEALEVLSETQRALVEARDLAAKLDERAAFARLLGAERALREILEVPGVHAFLAEVWLQMALVAAQRSELELADSLFAKALTLDPSRRVGAAEAAPPVIARSELAARARDAAQRSRFRIEPSPESATSFIDGRRRGVGAFEVDLAPGVHLLRIEAPGHRPYGVLIDALAGARRPFSVTLAALPFAAIAQVAPPPQSSMLPARSDAAALEPAGPRSDGAPSKRWWKRWPVWATAASVAVASGIAIGFAARDDRTVQRRTLQIDPGATEP